MKDRTGDGGRRSCRGVAGQRAGSSPPRPGREGAASRTPPARPAAPSPSLPRPDPAPGELRPRSLAVTFPIAAAGTRRRCRPRGGGSPRLEAAARPRLLRPRGVPRRRFSPEAGREDRGPRGGSATVSPPSPQHIPEKPQKPLSLWQRRALPCPHGAKRRLLPAPWAEQRSPSSLLVKINP